MAHRLQPAAQPSQPCHLPPPPHLRATQGRPGFPPQRCHCSSWDSSSVHSTGGGLHEPHCCLPAKQPQPPLSLPLLQGSRMSCLMQTLEPNHLQGGKTSFSHQAALPQGSQPLVHKLGPDHFIIDSFKHMSDSGSPKLLQNWGPDHSLSPHPSVNSSFLMDPSQHLRKPQVSHVSLFSDEQVPRFKGIYALRLKKSGMIRGTLCLPMILSAQMTES